MNSVEQNRIETFGNGGVMASGPKGVEVFQCFIIARALDTYAKHRITMSRAYTPKNLRATAERITGLTFKKTDYTGMATALRAHAEKLRDTGVVAVGPVGGDNG